MIYLYRIGDILNVIIALEFFYIAFLGIVTCMFLITAHYEVRVIRVGQEKALQRFAMKLVEMRKEEEGGEEGKKEPEAE